jgi:hypothetical protein
MVVDGMHVAFRFFCLLQRMVLTDAVVRPPDPPPMNQVAPDLPIESNGLILLAM